MESQALISVITINYNQSTVTNQFLHSMQGVEWQSIEIIVIDNNSEYSDYSGISTNFHNTTIIRSEVNLGFAGANNLGIIHSSGEYILFINNDTEVDPGFLRPLVEAFDADKKIGMVSPKIRFFNSPGKNIIQFAGGLRPGLISGIPSFKGFNEPDHGQYDESVFTPVIHGAGVMVQRKALKEVGVWPDVYFLYYEEIDWGESFRRLGYGMKYIHDSVIYHKESVSVGKSSPGRTYYMVRNRILFLRRNARGLRMFAGIFIFLFMSLPIKTIVHLFKKEFSHLTASWRGVFWHFRNRRIINLRPLLSESGNNSEITGGIYNYNVENKITSHD